MAKAIRPPATMCRGATRHISTSGVAAQAAEHRRTEGQCHPPVLSGFGCKLLKCRPHASERQESPVEGN